MRVPRSKGTISSEELRAMAEAGEGEVPRLEAELARALEVAHAVTVPSARVGIVETLRALGVRPGARVLLSALQYAPLVERMRRAGFVPSPIDVAHRSLEPKARAFDAACDARTEAIVATHAFGRPAPMRALRAIADRHGLALVEDAAQALGARPSGRALGALSDAAIVSFGPTKPLAGWGGGAVLTRSETLAGRLRAGRGGPGPIPSRALRLARGALFELVSRGAPIAWAPDPLVERWLADPPRALRPRPWQDLAMGAPEACLVRVRLGALRELTIARIRLHEELTRRIGGRPDAPNGIGFGVLLEVGSARAASRALRRVGIDAPHAELVDVGADGPNTGRLVERLLRVPVLPGASPDRVARRVRAALRFGADVG